MKISIIGSGRVGLSFGALLAKSGFQVLMTDKDPTKKQSVTAEALAFYEPDLQDCIKHNQANLEWTRYTEKILSSDFIFFCLSAPFNKKGVMDLKEVLNWAELIAENTKKEKYLIIKSTFPIGTNTDIQKIALEKKAPLFVITCPEFLRQGQALKDLSSPERLVIGSREIKAGKKLEEFYTKFSSPKRIIHTDPETAELSKLACNAYLATKISFINEFAGLCEQVKGDPKKLQIVLRIRSPHRKRLFKSRSWLWRLLPSKGCQFKPPGRTKKKSNYGIVKKCTTGQQLHHKLFFSKNS